MAKTAYKGKKNKDMPLKLKMKKYGSLMPFLLPAVALAIVFSYIPIAGILMAFKTNLNLYVYSPWEAFINATWTFDNFTVIFQNAEFMKILGATLLISVLKIVVLFPLPILFAVLFAEINRGVFGRIMMAIMMLPYFVSWAVATGIFSNVFSSYGPVNELLISIGAMDAENPVLWYQDPDKFLFLVLLTGGWKDIGWNMIIYLSAIMSIDPTYYEAARMDGATKMQQIFKITLPMIKSTIIMMFILKVCYILDAGFDQIYTMLNSSTRGTWEIIGTYVYRIGMQQSNYSLATAVGLMNSVVSLVIILIGNFISKKVSGEGIW